MDFSMPKLNYFQAICYTFRNLWQGAKLTWSHLKKSNTQRNNALSVANPQYFTQTEGLVTLQYPHERLPIPDTGRYQLHNEMADCIVCDKCAKICPVNCIEIEAIKATEQIGTTSDGSPIRLYAAKFDIDMAKCCFCGLCTTVCPTECLTMTPLYDVSTYALEEMNYKFSEMTPSEIAEKKLRYEQHQAQKAAEKLEKESNCSGR
jgi:formate hydrogenlyase subunit 6/NADH:ubiquinone oxidoreductase subunit I